MKKTVLVMVLFLGITLSSFAQGGAILLGLPYEEIHASNDEPMPYQYLREADVMWSKTIWRRIELTEKMNHTLYLPQAPVGDRMSLIDLLLYGIHKGGLTPYDESGSDEFGVIMTEEEVHTRMGAKTVTSMVETLEGWTEVTIDEPYKSENVKSYLVKELWYFDKQRSVMEVRIIGICPILEYFREDIDPDHEDPQYKKTFWVYYPEARQLLASQPIYNPYNDIKSITFDDIFQKRFFSSWIFKESSPYNRVLTEYTSGLETLLEAEAIKEEIFNFEQDLWEY